MKMWILLLFLCESKPCQTGSLGIPGWQIFDGEQACIDIRDNLKKLEDEKEAYGIPSHLWMGECTEIILDQE